MKLASFFFLSLLISVAYAAPFAVENYNCQFELQELEIIDHAPMLSFNPVELPENVSYGVAVDKATQAITLYLANELTGEQSEATFPADDIFPAVYVRYGQDRNGVPTQLRLHCRN